MDKNAVASAALCSIVMWWNTHTTDTTTGFAVKLDSVLQILCIQGIALKTTRAQN